MNYVLYNKDTNQYYALTVNSEDTSVITSALEAQVRALKWSVDSTTVRLDRFNRDDEYEPLGGYDD